MSLLRVEARGAVRIVRLDKARGNAIDGPLVEELIAAVRELRDDDTVRGVLLASAHPKLFCPGLDLVGLSELDRAAMQQFMLRFAELIQTLYSLPRPAVAAVGGHAVAGGCVLALTADARFLAQGAQIGLNEVKVGVPLPWSVALLLQASVAPGAITSVALLGRNFAGDEALRVGLADAVLDAAGFEEQCLKHLEEFAEKDAYSYARIKAYLREPVAARMRAEEAERLPEWLDGWFSPATRERVAATVAAIRRK